MGSHRESDSTWTFHNGFLVAPGNSYRFKDCIEFSENIAEWDSPDGIPIEPHQEDVVKRDNDIVTFDYFTRQNDTGEEADDSVNSKQTFLQKMPTRIFSRKERIHQKDEKVQLCPICEETFATTSLLLGHILTHTGEKPHVCDFCGSTFARQSDLEIHARIHLDGEVLCGVCNRTFASANILKKHDCNLTPESVFECVHCGKRFSERTALTRHMSSHKTTQRHQCEACGKSFTQAFRLKVHSRTHTGEKPYVCSICGTGFTRKETLKHHVRSHSGEKPHACKICGRTFAQSASLVVHKKTHLGEKNNVCDICGKKFSRAYHLRRHRETHSSKKPYTCEICGKAFAQDSGLKMHATMHSGDKPHKCTVCSKAFARAWHLKRHYETHDKRSSNSKLLEDNCGETAASTAKHSAKTSTVSDVDCSKPTTASRFTKVESDYEDA